ncbi:hypothetical protein FRB90_012060 [Tulasnella sp. 427]|nr:hypothetical protein FRB90_012060 [Tulasnella sp. 427]
MSIYDSGVYAVHPNRPRLPRIFKEAFISATVVWIMSHSVGLADLYLHATTRLMLVDLPVGADAQGSYPFGVTFNDAVCNGWNSSSPCLNNNGGWALDQPQVVLPGFVAIANGTQSNFKAITLADASDLAIVVPGESVSLSTLSFTAQTFGLRAQCESLNRKCLHSIELGDKVDCTQAGYPGIPYYEAKNGDPNILTMNDYIFGIVDGEQGGQTNGIHDLPGNGYTSNPASLAVQMRWSTHLDVSAETLSPDPSNAAVDFTPIPFITLYAGCSVTFSNVTVQYIPGTDSWTLLTEVRSSDTLASVLWSPTIWQLATDQLSTDMMAIALTGTIPNVTATLNQHLARTMLALSSGTMQATGATDVKEMVPSLLGQYPVVPVFLLISLLLLYALLAILVFASSWLTQDEAILVPREGKEDKEPQERSVLSLTQQWLIDPLPLVAASFPGGDGKDAGRSVENSAIKMVYDGPEARLGIGFNGRDGFGLRTRKCVRDLDE